MKLLKQSTAAVISMGPFVDPADGYTLKTGLVSAIDHATTGIKLSKNGGSLAVRHATVTASTYDSGGYGSYNVTLDTTDTNTLGRLRVIFAGNSTTLPVWMDFQVVEANVYDAIFGTDALFGAVMACAAVGTTTATGADATHVQITGSGVWAETTANHFRNKQLWAFSGTLAKQCLGVITDSALVSGEQRLTLGPGSPSVETLATGTKVLAL